MTPVTGVKDLVILVADRNMEFTVKGLLGRTQALGIREITYDLYQHPWHDAGCRSNSKEFLRPFVNRYNHALVLLDKEGCGQEEQSRTDIEERIEGDLSVTGWNSRASAIVIDPELEIWVWSDSPQVDNILGWKGNTPTLRNWLREYGYLRAGISKPIDPKKAFKETLRIAQKAHSSALFFALAQKVSIERCTDDAFVKFKTVLRYWFS